MAKTCSAKTIIAALHEEKDIVHDIVHEDIINDPRIVLRKIPDGGVVRRNKNSDSIIYGVGRQPAMAYRNLDHEPRALVDGEMRGRTQAGHNGLFDTQVNDNDPNACHGFCTLDFAQGYRRRTARDYGLDLDTPIQCARELDRLGEEHIRAYFKGFRNNFAKFGLDNFSDNLLNLVIQEGEANASVIAGDQFEVTKGGWQAPPQLRITIHFLNDYRDHIMAELEMASMKVPENWKLEVELPSDDWFDAVQEHLAQRHAMVATGTSTPMVNYDRKMLTDPREALHGREYHDFGNIRCFFNERPIRGFFKRVGTVNGNPDYEFTRVYHWLNEPGEEGGLVLKPNHQYREDTITVDNVPYKMVTLMPHIHPKSFMRYGLMKPHKPMGQKNMGVNYNVEIVDGADIKNNIHRDKFALAARHEFRFKSKYPEFSGFVAYLHGRQPGYELQVTPRNYQKGPDEFASPEDFRKCDLIDGTTTANCAVCEEVPTSEGECVDAENAPLGSIGLEPTGDIVTVFDGDEHNLRLTLRRSGDRSRAASVSVNIEDESAQLGTHYGDPASYTVEFAVGQEFAYLDIPITGASGDAYVDLNFEVLLDSVTGATLDAGASTAYVTIEDATA